MDRFAFKVVNIDARWNARKDGSHTWINSDAEIDKLADKRVKAFFLVNPSQPAVHGDEWQGDAAAGGSW